MQVQQKTTHFQSFGGLNFINDYLKRNAFRADACCYQQDTIEYLESENITYYICTENCRASLMHLLMNRTGSPLYSTTKGSKRRIISIYEYTRVLIRATIGFS